MKLKYILTILFLFLFYSNSFALINNIENALDGGSRAINKTIDTRTNTLPYKSYDSTVTTNTTINIYSALGRFGSAGFIINDSSTMNITFKFSVDASTYNDAINIKPTECLNFDDWLIFKAISIAPASTGNATYRMVVR